jgi:hypothetical protein
MLYRTAILAAGPVVVGPGNVNGHTGPPRPHGAALAPRLSADQRKLFATVSRSTIGAHMPRINAVLSCSREHTRIVPDAADAVRACPPCQIAAEPELSLAGTIRARRAAAGGASRPSPAGECRSWLERCPCDKDRDEFGWRDNRVELARPL